VKQTVLVTQLADRHAGHDRDFAASFEVVVKAGSLSDVLRQVAGELDLETSRFSITISEPFEP
jgi:hypothetical protein